MLNIFLGLVWRKTVAWIGGLSVAFGAWFLCISELDFLPLFKSALSYLELFWRLSLFWDLVGDLVGTLSV